MLNAEPAQPRYMAFLLRSYTGSRQQLLVAARRLLEASPLRGDGSRVNNSGAVWLMRRTEQSPEHVAAAVSFRNSVSVTQALGIARAVERQLEDPKKPGTRETVRIDLLWVQDVEAKTPTLELPHPDLFKTLSVAFLFERALHERGNEAFPNERQRDRMAAALQSAPDTQKTGWNRPLWLDESLGFYRTAHGQTWFTEEPGRAEALSMAGFSVGTALRERVDADENRVGLVDPQLGDELDRMVLSGKSPNLSAEADAEWSFGIKRGQAAAATLDSLPMNVLVPVSVDLPQDMPDSKRAFRWAAEVQSACREHNVQMSQVVVVADEPTNVRGYVLGQLLTGMPPGVQLLDTELSYVPDTYPEAIPTYGESVWHLRIMTGALFH